MREANIQRLKELNVGITSPLYLVYKNLFKDLSNAIGLHAKGKVLDIGCGNKPYEGLFNGISSYTGCDIIQSSENKVDIICPATEILSPDGTFDTVFSSQVLEHVDDHTKMLSEACRLLKNDGVIILSAPMVWEHHEEPYDYFRFTKHGLKYIFEKTGFEIVEMTANGGKWVFLGQMAQNVIASSYRKKKSFFRTILKATHMLFLKVLINILFNFFEKIDKDKDFITLNYVVVAKKKLT